MTSSLALAITLSCFALSTCNHEDRTVLAKTIYRYPAKISVTGQAGCPSDDKRELIIAEVREDIRNILQRNIRKCSCSAMYVTSLVPRLRELNEAIGWERG